MRDKKDIIRDFKICSFDADCIGCSYYTNGLGASCSSLNKEVLELLEKDTKGYEDGLKDAWGIARLVANMDVEDFNECFGTSVGLEDVINLYKPEEIKHKIEEYENDFHVGDVIRVDDIYGIVTCIEDDDDIYVLFGDGSCGIRPKKDFEKINEKLDIYNILKKIKENH